MTKKRRTVPFPEHVTVSVTLVYDGLSHCFTCEKRVDLSPHVLGPLLRVALASTLDDALDELAGVTSGEVTP